MTAPGAGGVGDGGGGADAGAPGTGGPDTSQQQGSGFVDLNGLEIPPELHSHMERYIKEKVDPHLTRKQQELADLRRPYEQFEGIDGLADVPVEELQSLLEFRQANETPEAFADWYTGVAERSIEENPEGFEQWWKDIGQKLGYEFDGDDTGLSEDDGTGVESDEIQALRAELQAFKDEQSTKETAREQEQSINQRREAVDKQLTEFAGTLGDLEDDAKQEILSDVMGLALGKYANEAPDEQIPKAVADWKRIKGAGEEGLIDQKLRQPDPALNGGGPADTTDPVRGFEHAHQIARERLRA